MQVALGALMGVLVTIGLVKSVYDRYFKKRFKTVSQQASSGNAKPENLLSHQDWRVRLGAVRNTPPNIEAIDDLIPLLGDDDFDVRSASRDKLVEIGKPSTQSLINVLNSSSQDARQLAVEALGKIDDNTALQGLLAAVDDESKWVRLAIVESLAQFKTQSARKALVQMRDSDSDEQVRQAAETALRGE